MNKKDEKKALAALASLLDESMPEDTREMRQELETAGMDPALARARMRVFAKISSQYVKAQETDQKEVEAVKEVIQVTEPVPVPWIEETPSGWKIDLAVAAPASEERSWMTFDFRDTGLPGGVRIGLLLHTSDVEDSSLTVEWDADFMHEEGWLLSIFHASENEPFFKRNIGGGYRGSVILTTDMLGTDPALVPLKFSFDPDRSE